MKCSTREEAHMCGRERRDRVLTIRSILSQNSGQLKDFSMLAMVGLAYAILNSWVAMAASLSLSLPSGGPVAT